MFDVNDTVIERTDIYMLDSYWKHFKSGTDIRGVAIDGVEGEPLDLTDSVVDCIAVGFAEWLSERSGRLPGELTVSVGRDSRLSGPRIRDVVVNSLTGAGVRVIDCGLASTPAMFMTTVDLNCDAAVQITASHHPFHRNGLKFSSLRRAGGQRYNRGSRVCSKTFGKPGIQKEVVHDRLLRRRIICRNTPADCAPDLRGVKAQDYEHPLKGFI